MKVSESPLLRMYTYCSTLISFKRMLFTNIQLNPLPPSLLKEQISMSSNKMYICIKKLMVQMQIHLCEFTNHRKYSEHLPILNTIIAKLKNNSELLTQEQKFISDAFQIMDEWEQTKDPVVYYEVKERIEVRGQLKSILREIDLSYQVNKQVKKPLYIRKLERELRDNLEMIGEQQSKYNEYQSNISLIIHKKANKLLAKLFDSINKMSRDSLVQDQKNQLLKNYIDIFNDKAIKVTEKQLINYRRDLARTICNIQNVFVEEKKSFELLIQYISDIYVKIKEVQTNFIRIEDEISKDAINIPEDINAIVSFQEIFDVINQSKYYFESANEFLQLKQQLIKLMFILEEAISSAIQFLDTIRVREFKSKVNLIEQFIQDKKVMQAHIKKEKVFQTALFQTVVKFFKKIYKKFNENRPKNNRNDELNKIRHERKYEKLFDTYFSQVQVYEKSKTQRSSSYPSNSSSAVKSNNVNKIKQIETFIDNLRIFQDDIDSIDSYQCSLGPKLLIHGKMKILSKGITYESNFNKKNIFFGGTMLFLPKEEIFQINKETAFFLFPDVIEIITKKGGVYFHSLGKRQAMYEHLNEVFFPEVNAENTNCAEQIAYHQFKGSQADIEQGVKKYMDKLQYEVVIGDIPNCSIRSLFTKYFSNQEFVYQGKSYKDFKHFTVEVAEGTNIKGTDFTPGIPYYMKLVTENANQSQNFPQSQRFFTYGKSVPMIPLVSKGGQGICQQKSVFRWGGPHCFIIQIFTTLSGFSLTEGMMVKSRQVFQEKDNVLHYQMSGLVTFETSSAINGMLRTPALSNLKQFLIKVFEVIKKIQRNKKKRANAKKANSKQQAEQAFTQIEFLEEQVSKVKRRLKWTVIGFVLLYISTVILLLNK